MRKVLIIYIALAGLVGCRPQQQMIERYTMQTDSVVVAQLRSELNQKTVELMGLKIDISQMREENLRLQSEVVSHIIKYDTTAQVGVDGQYPKALEITTSTKQKLEKELHETKVELIEERKLTEVLTNKVANMEYELNATQEIDIMTETDPCPACRWWRWMLWGIVIGVVLTIASRIIVIRWR